MNIDLNILIEDHQKERYSYELYPFDAGMCDKCENSQNKDFDTLCAKYHKRCPSVRGCTEFKLSKQNK